MSAKSVLPGDTLGDQPAGSDGPGSATRVTGLRGAAARLPRALGGTLRAHLPFAAVALLAAALRVVVMLGYPPAMFFNDSYNYMTDAVTGVPDIQRASGYPFLLKVLSPFHSLTVVSGLQAVAGLAMGVAIYAVLRRRGLPWWGATICALPVLFDVFELQLEHMIAADVLFYALLTAAVILLCWWDKPPVLVAALAGLLTGYAATVRSVGELMLVVIVAGLLARRMGWRRIVAALVTGLIPMASYMVWYHAREGQYALNAGGGTFLYSRVQSFADCSRMNPPADLRALCDSRSVAKRPDSQEYLWSNNTPLARLTGRDNRNRFTPRIESLTGRFAKLAIEKQPLGYAKVVVKDVLTTFAPSRVDPSDTIGNLTGTGSKFQFEPTVLPVPTWVTHDAANARAARDFGGADYGRPSVVQPWARFLWLYQHVYLRGPLLFLFILTGFAGIVASLRRRDPARARWGPGGLALLPWLTGVALLVLPPMTAGFSYRYSLAAVPALCLAAGLAFAGRENVLPRNALARLRNSMRSMSR